MYSMQLKKSYLMQKFLHITIINIHKNYLYANNKIVIILRTINKFIAIKPL